MLLSMLKEHRLKQYSLKHLQEKRRQDASSALYRFNEDVMNSINRGVATAYVNQCTLDAEMKQLQLQASRFSKITARWVNELNGFQNALKELGDVENWTTSIENDLKAVANSLQYLHKNNAQNTLSASSNTS